MEKVDIDVDGVALEFFTKVKGLTGIEECLPQPAKNFVPSWFKNIPAHKDLNPTDTVVPKMKTVKTCPSFPDYFSTGVVLPMWADTTIEFDEKEGRYRWHCGIAGSPFEIDLHYNEQFLDHAPVKFLNSSPSFVFKFVSPWYLRTPNGYSSLQLPMYYHFDNNFSVLPGVIDTDIFHSINQQVMYFGDGKEIFIPRGTPLVHYVPVRRESHNPVARYVDDEPGFAEKLDTLDLEIKSQYGGQYRKLQRKNRKSSDESD